MIVPLFNRKNDPPLPGNNNVTSDRDRCYQRQKIHSRESPCPAKSIPVPVHLWMIIHASCFTLRTLLWCTRRSQSTRFRDLPSCRASDTSRPLCENRSRSHIGTVFCGHSAPCVRCGFGAVDLFRGPASGRRAWRSGSSRRSATGSRRSRTTRAGTRSRVRSVAARPRCRRVIRSRWHCMTATGTRRRTCPVAWRIRRPRDRRATRRGIASVSAGKSDTTSRATPNSARATRGTGACSSVRTGTTTRSTRGG